MPEQVAPVRFTLSRHPVTADEQRVLNADTAAQGLDGCYWEAMNGLLTTSSRSDTPLVLRAMRSDRLTGLAYLMECRRTNRCLFPGLLGRTLDLIPTPAYYWTRGDAAVDLLGSPGFVADGEDRHTFYRDAIGFLNTRYLSGIVMEERDAPAAASCYETAVMDWGRYSVEPGGMEAVLRRHRNLRRKLSAFRNKGGTLETVERRLDAADRDRVLHCLAQSAGAAPLRAPFQENYANMVRWASESSARGLVHILARIGDEIAGYHSYLRSGTRLQCLSGGFDRTRHTTHHAYENILLETMKYAETAGLREVAFGPVGNPTKAALMPESVPFVVRFYSRYSAMRRMMAAVVPRSALRPSRVAVHAVAGAPGAGDAVGAAARE